MRIIIRNLQKRIPISPIRAKAAVLKTLSSERVKKSGEVTVCFVNDKKIKTLNKKFLKHDTATDVIAFNLTQENKSRANLVADIVISTDTAVKNARVFGTCAAYESYLYLTHGVLHVLGYKDNTARQKKIMQNKSLRILQSLNIKQLNN